MSATVQIQLHCTSQLSMLTVKLLGLLRAEAHYQWFMLKIPWENHQLIMLEKEELPVSWLLALSRHLWLQRHLRYWHTSRCPSTCPPNVWIPWILLLAFPSFGILLIVQAFNHLATFFAALSTLAIFVFFNLFAFSRHRMRHISGVQNPAFAGFFFGSIIQSLLCYFLYLVPRLWSEFIWAFLAVILLIVSVISLWKLFSDPGIINCSRISDVGETLTILDVAKGVISEDDFCWVCEIVMPAFTKHCRLCNACMLGLDHHCLFLTRCVAANNHRSFVLFMIEAMFANLLFARAAVSYLNLQVFIGEVSSLREAMGQDVYVVVLFFINCFGFLYILFLMFFQFKVITDGGTTYYSPDGRALHRTWKDLWKFEAVSWSQRMKIFLQFLLGEYSFYKTKMKEQALRLVWYEWHSPPKRSSIRALLCLDFYSGWLESAKFFLAKLPSSASQPDAKNRERCLGLLQSFALNPGYTSFIQG